MSKETTDGQIIPSGNIIDNYEVIDLIGVGGFGGIYKVKDNRSSKIYAMKTESYDSKDKMLPIEIDIIKELKGYSFPKYHDCGKNDEYKFNYLIINCLGASASVIQAYHKYELDIEIVYNIVLKMLDIIKIFHSLGYTHCDIKPSNFLLQQNPNFPFVLIDFGCSKKHIDPSTNKPFPCTIGKDFLGTRKYASISVLQSHSCGRKDDLLSWFYSFLDLSCSELPWDGIKDKEKVIGIKQSLKLSDLEYKFPNQFQQIYDYLKKLEYEDEPDYDYIRKIYIEGMESDHFYADKFDWPKFISNHSNMDKFEKIVTMCTLKVINQRNRERNNNINNQKKIIENKENTNNHDENPESIDTEWHCTIQ